MNGECFAKISDFLESGMKKEGNQKFSIRKLWVHMIIFWSLCPQDELGSTKRSSVHFTVNAFESSRLYSLDGFLVLTKNIDISNLLQIGHQNAQVTRLRNQFVHAQDLIFP